MRGIIFTIDALFALMIVIASVPLVIIIASKPVEITDQPVKVYAESAIYSLSELRIRNIMKEPVIADMYSSGFITEEDLDRLVIDKILELWTSNSSLNESLASNMTEQLVSSMLPNMAATIVIENETVFDTSMMQPVMVATGRRVASGYMKGNRSTGYISSVFLTAIGGRRGSSYFFFGGFSGQGNLTVSIDDIPLNSTAEEIYMEASPGGNFTMYVNNANCGTFNKTSDPIYLTANCTGSIVPGTENIFMINFTGNNISTNYIGGGFLRVSYTTNQLATDETYSKKFRPGGIDGIINYFGSVYVNGNVTAMEIMLHVLNNHTTIVNVGNRTVINATGNSTEQIITATNDTLGALLNYSSLNFATTPVRIAASVPNITDIAQEGNADIILITDVSGSMAYRMDSDNYGTDRTCTDALINASSTTRLSLAKCIDKEFISAILGGVNNRIGLVSFSTNADSYVNLTTNQTLLNATINGYTSTVSTCFSCALNRAYSILANHSSLSRKQFIIAMTDGVTNVRSTSCSNMYGADTTTDNITLGAAGRIAMRGAEKWNFFNSPTAQQINGMTTNATAGFGVGNNGAIIMWNGTEWGSMTSPTTNALNGVDIYNSTFALAVGASGTVLRWNGSAWASAATIANSPVLYSVSIYNSTRMYIAGERSNRGRIYSSTDGGSTWVEEYTNNDNFYGIKIANSSVAYAVGENGIIARRSTTTWATMTTPTGDDLWSVDIYNDTYALAAGGDSGSSVIIMWNGATWASVYDDDGDTLRSVVAESKYAAGLGGTIIEYNGTWRQSFSIPALYEGNSTTGASCTTDQDSCSESVSFPALNANYSSCRAHRDMNTTVHSIGFGPIATCSFARTVLQAVASCGNGTFYASSNSSELREIYSGIAKDILEQKFFKQSTMIFGNASSILYPDSYIMINYTREAPAAYQEISTDVETERFSCSQKFLVPGQLKVEDIKVTSFSGNLWTTNVSINSEMTGYANNTVYFLPSYDADFQRLGDPFIVSIPPAMIRSGGNNTVYVYTGDNIFNTTAACPVNSSVIYRARFRASVPYGNVFPELWGSVVRIYYDINHDGTADGFTDITVGGNLPDFRPAVRNMDQLSGSGNALDDALIRLMNVLNFVSYPWNAGPPGSQTNPVDIRLSDVAIDAAATGGVPFEWGPLNIRLDVKI